MAKKNSNLATMLLDIDSYCLEDKNGKFFLFCNYHKHKGYVKKYEAIECIKRECWHYEIKGENELGLNK